MQMATMGPNNQDKEGSLLGKAEWVPLVKRSFMSRPVDKEEEGGIRKTEDTYAALPIPQDVSKESGGAETQSREGNVEDLYAYSQLNEDNIDRLTRQFLRIPPIPYVGAGLSIPIYPNWKRALEKLVSQLHEDAIECRALLDIGDYAAVAQNLYNKDHGNFGMHLGGLFSKGILEKKKSELSRALRILPWLCRGAILTTNFDQCIETVYKDAHIKAMQNQVEFEDLRVQLPTRDFEDIRHMISEGDHVLIKLHGSIDQNMYDVVFTTEQYEKFYGTTENPKPMRRVLREILTMRNFLFLGCSLGKDKSMDVLLEQARHADPHDIRGYSYALIEMPEDEKARLDKERFLNHLRIRPIWYPYGKHQYIEVVLRHILRALHKKHAMDKGYNDLCASELESAGFVAQAQ